MIQTCCKHDLMLLISEAVARRCSVKKEFLEFLQNSQGNTYDRVSFLIKLQDEAGNFTKKVTQALVFSCEFCEISNNNFYYRTPPVAASVILLQRINTKIKV